MALASFVLLTVDRVDVVDTVNKVDKVNGVNSPILTSSTRLATLNFLFQRHYV